MVRIRKYVSPISVNFSYSPFSLLLVYWRVQEWTFHRKPIHIFKNLVRLCHWGNRLSVPRSLPRFWRRCKMKFPRWLRNQPTSWTFETPKIEQLRFLPVQFSCKGPHRTSILEFPRNFWSRQSYSFCYPVSNSTNLTQNKVAQTLKTQLKTHE